MVCGLAIMLPFEPRMCNHVLRFFSRFPNPKYWSTESLNLKSSTLKASKLNPKKLGKGGGVGFRAFRVLGSRVWFRV